VPNIPWAWKWLWAHLIVLLGNVCPMEACFDLFGDSVSLYATLVHSLHRMDHRLGNDFAQPMVLQGDVGQVKACFGPCEDSVNLGA
jgi:hypothetical protein